VLDWLWLPLGTLRVLLHDRHALLVELWGARSTFTSVTDAPSGILRP
jgi:hypothetical protein